MCEIRIGAGSNPGDRLKPATASCYAAVLRVSSTERTPSENAPKL